RRHNRRRCFPRYLLAIRNGSRIKSNTSPHSERWNTSRGGLLEDGHLRCHQRLPLVMAGLYQDRPSHNIAVSSGCALPPATTPRESSGVSRRKSFALLTFFIREFY